MTKLKELFGHYHLEALLILCLGTVVLSSLNTTHDWGGDFAQYLDNAKDLINGQRTAIHEVLDAANFSPMTRGAGFSLLIAPIHALFGENIGPFIVFISLVFLWSAWLICNYFKHALDGKPLALLATGIIFLHPEVLALKYEILPTFPFLCLLYLYLLRNQIKKSQSLILLVILTSTLVSFRNVGWVVYFTVIIHLIFSRIKQPRRKKALKLLGFVVLVPVLDVTIKWIVFGSISNENLEWYKSAFSFNQEILWSRLLYYYDLLLIFFKPPIAGELGFYLRKFMTLLAAIGWIFRIIHKKWNAADTFTILYCLILLTYEGVSGIRFLIPILPIILIYNFNGIAALLAQLNHTLFLRVRLVFFSCFFLLFLPNTWQLILTSDESRMGPNQAASEEAFSYVKKVLPTEAPIAFHKPWVLHYYTDRTSMAINPKYGIKGFTMDYLVQKMKDFNVNYLLMSINKSDRAIYSEKLVRGVQNDPRFMEQWRNDAFVFLSFEGDIGTKKFNIK